MGTISPALRLSSAGLTIIAAGSAWLASAAYGGAGGGIGAPDAPEPRGATCVKSCLDVDIVAIGGKIEVSGQHLQRVRSVFFPARDGRYVGAKARKVGAKRLRAKVPKGAASGRPVVVDDLKQTGTVPSKLRIKAAAAFSAPKRFKITSARVEPKQSYVGGRMPTATYVFKSEGAVDVRMDITNATNGALVKSVVQRHREPFATHRAVWNGLTSGGDPAADGKYKLSITPLAGGKAEKLKLRRYSHIFPLRAKHSYGDGLGAGRGHMGQDVFARCGEPIVAARGGRVTFNKTHPRAGLYVVIDGYRNNFDYMYAHLRKSLVKRGDHVRTGQVIGYNGDTGNASGCHLHFEIWKGRWQQGGKVVNPTPLLRRWDRWS